MTNYVELKGRDLLLNFDALPEFNTTKDIQAFDKVIGQKRAVASIDLGLKMESKEYNIFISGKAGTGKTGYIVRKIEEYAQLLPAPEDWCYVYNFEEPNEPMIISLSTGHACRFKEDMADFIKYLLKEVPVFFNSQKYENEKNSIIEKYDKLLLVLTKGLSSRAKNHGFNIKETTTGEFVFIPLKDNKEMTQEEFAALSPEEKKHIEGAAAELRLLSLEIIKETRELAKKMDEELKQLDEKIAESIITLRISVLAERYAVNEKAERYFRALKKDIITNISYFFETEDDDKKEKELDTLFFRRYDVNVVVSNDPSKGAPVVFADSAHHGHLFGNIEYENKQGNLITDFTLIKSGYLHRANGGFLIIKAHELLSHPSSWETLKRCINLEIIYTENTKYNIDVLPISTLKPQNVPLKTKVILLGTHLLYSLLLQYDMDFEKLFKIKAEFDSEIEKDLINSTNMVGFLRNYVERNNLLHITREGVIRLLKYSSRIAEDRNYYSASMSKLLKIVDISNFYARRDKSELIEERHVLMALQEDEGMHGLVRKKIMDMYRGRKYVVELKGTKIGQINGLSVADYGDCVVGQQHRITVSTFAGRSGVINIERETAMSGSIHSKGIMILSGFVGELIGQEAAIAFNASIAFEQLYSGIEGDSASAAELLALLSSLSEIPLKQGLAITGSVNQKGEIQPIGGVNDKIEGYFAICSIFGLDGSHGVVIPVTNLEDLVLNDVIIDAVEKGLFHIYAVSTIEDCLQIFCDENFTRDVLIKDGRNIMIDAVKERILGKLQKYNNILMGRKKE